MASAFMSVRRAFGLRPVCGLAVLGVGWAAGLPVKAADVSVPPHPASLDRMIVEQSKRNGVPEKLVRRIVMRESKYDPRARNHIYWGLMQISYPTAKSMGFKGTREELLNPLTNLRYAVPYLANAFVIAGKHEDEAVRLYAAGYYFTARKRGLLNVLRTADSTPLSGVPANADEMVASAAPPPPSDYGVFGSLLNAMTQPAAAAPPPQVAAAAPQPAPAQAADSPHVANGAGLAPETDAKQPDIALVADKDGEMHAPKRWLHDGGVTHIARGEQGIENVAAYAAASGAPPAATHSHKSTVFASIDMPQAAQAYASADGQDPRVTQSSSQAAIANATSPQPAVPQQVAAVEPAAVAPVKTPHRVNRTIEPVTRIAKAKVTPAVVAASIETKEPEQHIKPAKDDAPMVVTPVVAQSADASLSVYGSLRP